MVDVDSAMPCFNETVIFRKIAAIAALSTGLPIAVIPAQIANE